MCEARSAQDKHQCVQLGLHVVHALEHERKLHIKNVEKDEENLRSVAVVQAQRNRSACNNLWATMNNGKQAWPRGTTEILPWAATLKVECDIRSSCSTHGREERSNSFEKRFVS